MIARAITYLKGRLSRGKVIRAHSEAVEAYSTAKRRGDTRGQRMAFDRLRAATNARLAAGL